MFQKKKEYLSIIEEISKISLEQEVNSNIFNMINDLKIKISEFNIKIPVIGGFNAGKTSLINEFLGIDLLTTDIIPETAISTELKYGTNEEVLAYKENGTIDTYSISNLKEINVKNYKYLELILNNQKLKDLDNITIVDMPGIDSNIEAHNKAIMNYIKEGVYYILATDVEHGLKESSLKFLNEISEYGLDFSVILTKSDKKIESDLKEIKETIKNMIYSLVGNEIFVGLTSAKAGNIGDFENILAKIDKDFLFKKRFKNQIEILIEKIEKELTLRVKTQNLDEKDLKEKIDSINKKIEELNRKLKNEEKDIEYKMEHQVKTNILNDIRISLENSSSTLALAYKQGENSFKMKVNEIVRPILIKSSNINISNVFENSVKNVNVTMGEVNQLLDFGNNALEKLNTGTNILNTVVNTIQNPAIRMGLVGLAVTTALVAPWLELTILLLPEILKLFGFNNEKKKDEAILSSIKDEIIPKILSGISSEISSNLTQTKKDFINNIQNEVEESKQELLNSLNKIIEEKKLRKEEFESKIKNIESNINQLNNLKNEL